MLVMKGLKKGLEQGRAEGAIVIAKKMKAMGLDDATIMQATGMSASDLAEL